MNNPEIYIAKITSNTGKLSAKVIHDGLVNLVRHEVEQGESVMKVIAPKDTEALSKAISHRGPEDKGAEVEAAVGVPPVTRPWEFGGSPLYPLFVEQGTGLFSDRPHYIFPKDKEFMKIPPNPEKGYPFITYAKFTRGQMRRDYVLGTFVFMHAMLRVNGEGFKAELTTKLEPDKIE